MFVVKDKEEDDFFASLADLPDRVVGILATTVIDDRLTEAIQAHWHDTKLQGGERLFDRLFNYSGALGSFGTRIEIGFAMGLYSDELMREMHTIRKIRNAFAHKLSPKDFNAQTIIDLTKNLKTPDKFPITAENFISYKASPQNPPTLLGMMQAFLTHSHVTDTAGSRSRFIRATEIVSGFLFAISADLNLVKRQPPI